MKRVLQITIRVFWAVLGIYGLILFFGSLMLLAAIFSTNLPISPALDGLVILIFGAVFFLSAAILYGSFYALFRFSPGIIGPTLALLLAWLDLKFLHWINVQSRFLDDSSPGHPAIAFAFLGALLAAIFTTRWLYRRLRGILAEILFPELRHSGARVFYT